MLVRMIYSSLLLALSVSSCGGASSSAAGGSALPGLIAQFQGAASIEKKGDTSYAIKWTRIPADGVVYGVYKADEGAAFDYDSPYETTELNLYQFESTTLYTSPSQCFVVRVANFGGDKNEAKVCTGHSPIDFKGAQSLERQTDGTYLILWEKLPLSDAIFSVYESRNDSPYNFDLPSYDAIKVNFLKTDLFERGNKYCFIVRYYHPDLKADQNQSEVCTDLDPPMVFGGVASLSALSPTELLVQWTISTDVNVALYHIYQGSDFKELKGEQTKDQASKTITGLVTGRQYSFGVKGVDIYGREDNNLRILSIVMP